MSENNRHPGRKRARRNRDPRPSANISRPERNRDHAVLAKLPYRKGWLTDRELELFAELRGELTPEEIGEIKQVDGTLRRPLKRLLALDLTRYWGAPLTKAQRQMLPWFAGLRWVRPLPTDRSLDPVAVARHLLCDQEVPAFLFEPFAHPELYDQGLGWDLVRILGMVTSGRGLEGLREMQNFWTRVPQPVFDRFLETPADVPILEGLTGAFVAEWGGPDWLAKQAYGWTTFRSIAYGLPPVLRVAYDLSVDPLPPEEARKAALERIANFPRFLRGNFGRARRLSIPAVMPKALDGWRSKELHTPEDFDEEEARSSRYTTFYFQDAALGKTSLWSLSRKDQHLTVQVNVARNEASLFATDGSPEAKEVMALWADANGLAFW